MTSPKRPTLLLLLTLGALLVSPVSAHAQGGSYESDLMEDEGEMIDWVEVPKEMGDGVVSTRDVVCLAEFTIWMFDRLVQSVDPTLAMPPDAAGRAVEFWAYMWPGLDDDSKAMMSQMDLIFPAARANWDAATTKEQAAIEQEVLGLITAIWGDQAGPTASYFANEISYEDYIPGMDRIMAGFPSYNEDGEIIDEADGSEDRPQLDIHDTVSTYLGNFIEYQ